MQMPRKHVKVFGKTNYADATPPRRARQKLIANFCAVQSLRSPPAPRVPPRFLASSHSRSLLRRSLLSRVKETEKDKEGRGEEEREEKAGDARACEREKERERKGSFAIAGQPGTSHHSRRVDFGPRTRLYIIPSNGNCSKDNETLISVKRARLMRDRIPLPSVLLSGAGSNERHPTGLNPHHARLTVARDRGNKDIISPFHVARARACASHTLNGTERFFQSRRGGNV